MKKEEREEGEEEKEGEEETGEKAVSGMRLGGWGLGVRLLGSFFCFSSVEN